MASQAQPIIPVTMPYGGGYAANQLQQDIYTDGNNTRDRVVDASHRLQHELHSDGNHTRAKVEHDSDEIRDNQRWDTEFTRRDIRNAQDADAANTTAATIALRAAVDRNIDYLANQAEVNSTKAATDATRVELTTMNTASDIKTGQTNNQNLTTAALNGLGVQIATSVGGIHQSIITQAQAMLLGQKDREVNAANQLGAIQLLAQQNFQATQLAQAKDTAAIQLQAAGYNSKVMEKLAECCCENKMAHAATQSVVVQSGSNNSASIQQGQYNSMTQQLFQVQQELLLAKLGK